MGSVERSIAGSAPGEADGTIRRLQAELLLSERRLQAALSDVTAANSQLRASNDDQLQLNEELRSTVEELKASETELQALNGELGSQVDALAQANLDMHGVIESTRIALVFLDQSLRIRSFTPAMRDVLPLRDADRGRAVTDLRLLVDYPGFAADARHVLRTHEAIDRHAGSLSGCTQYLVRLLPHRDTDDQVAGLVVTFLDVSATVRAEQALGASDERFRQMAAAVPALLFIAGPDLAWHYVNPPFYALTGQMDGAALDDGWAAALHPDDLEAHRTLWRQASEAALIFEHEARLCRADGTWCWFLIRAVPQLDEAGRPIRWYGSCVDIDDRRRAETSQGLLLAERQHRIKNILAVVRSVLTRTLESSTGLDHFAAHLAGRIGALARTQGVAARTADGYVVLDDLVYQELTAHGGQDERQFSVLGPLVRLPPRMADSLGLAIHELVTNSIKYGALAVQSGRVSVGWRVEQDGAEACQRLDLEWQESGVPLTDLQPTRRGFGRELIEQGLPYELGAVTAMEFRPGGLRCTIGLMLSHAIPRQGSAGPRSVGKPK